MIIIAENKKNHYMIKSFLVDFNKCKNITENSSKKFHPVFKDELPGQNNPVGEYPIITDKEDRPATKEEIEFVADKNPKYKSFLNKFLNTTRFIMPFMAAVLLYNSTHLNSPEEKTAIERIQQANSSQSAIQSNNTKEDLNFSIEYDQSTDKEEVKQNILRHEGFRGLPYLDHHQWSIGHGTKVFSTADLDEGEHKRLENDWKEQRKKGVSKADWIEKTIPGWRKKFFDTYSIQNDNEPKTSPVNLTQAGIAADQEVAHVISEMNKVKYFKVLPKDTKQAFYDMAYNMGPGFLDKF